jgi:hypothetical protein
MRRILTTTIAVCAVALLPAFAWAFDLGGSLDSSVTGNSLFTPGVNLGQTDKVGLWLMQNFSDDVSISMKGNYKLAFSNLLLPGFNPAIDIVNSGDLDSLVFYAAVPNAFGEKSRFKIWAGRTVFADFSGDILNHKLDGISTEFTFPGMGWKFGVGTSALLFRHTSGLFGNSQDLGDVADWSKIQTGQATFDPAKILVAPKIVVVSGLSFPQLFGTQTLDIGLLGQVDLDPRLKATGSAVSAVQSDDRVPVDTGYFGLGLGGKIAGPLYWNLSGWLELGYTLTAVNKVYQPTLILSNMDSLRFTLYLTSFAGTVIDLGGKFKLGDESTNGVFSDSNTGTDGLATSFSGISFTGGPQLFKSQLGNLIQADLGLSMKPFSAVPGAMQDFQIELRGYSFMRPMINGPTFETLVAKTTEFYLGTEADLSLSWRPLSDMGLSGGFGVLFANIAAIKREPIEYKANLALSLSF